MTPLDKSLKRSLNINGRDYVITLAPTSLKVTQKGHRLGVELKWSDLVSGESALAVALHASIGKFQNEPPSVTPSPKSIARRRLKAKAATAPARRKIRKRSAPKRS